MINKFSLIIFLSFCIDKIYSAKLPGVILVPGIASSRLNGRYVNVTKENKNCTKDRGMNEWFTFWITWATLPFSSQSKCLYKELKLEYDENSRSTSNLPGLEVSASQTFGSTESIENIDPKKGLLSSFTIIYGNLVEYLLGKGYTNNKTLRGAPYDFRKAPNELGDYLRNLTQLVEETYRINGNTKVVLVGYSMGSSILLYWLNNLPTQEWKEKYIYAMVSIAGPIGGSVKSLKALISGVPLHKFFLNNHLEMRNSFRSFPSFYWMLPRKTDENEVLVMAPDKNYTANDYQLLFKNINHSLGNTMLNNLEQLLKPPKHPGVKLYCIYSLSERNTTDHYLDYRMNKGKWYDKDPYDGGYGPGDGSITQKSLEECSQWPNTEVIQMDDAEHQDLLRDETLIKFIYKILRNYSEQMLRTSLHTLQSIARLVENDISKLPILPTTTTTLVPIKTLKNSTMKQRKISNGGTVCRFDSLSYLLCFVVIFIGNFQL